MKNLLNPSCMIDEVRTSPLKLFISTLLILMALAAATMLGGGCAVLAGAAAGGATGYIAGHEAGEEEAHEEMHEHDHD